MTIVVRLGLLFTIWVASSGGVPALAQDLLYAEQGGQWRLVARVDDETPMVVVGQELKSGSRTRYALQHVNKFEPYYVRVSDANLTIYYAPGDRNKELGFKAEFESSYQLASVFVVVEMDERELLVHEVGNLAPRKPTRISFRFALDNYPSSSRYRLHVFASGKEVLNSSMPTEVVDHVLAQMVAEKIAGVANTDPQPLVGPIPLYPKAFRKKGLSGSATVSFVVTPDGKVSDPVVTEATEPAFGEAAVQAIREWWFSPKVVDGRCVESRASFPFKFAPPVK